MGNACNGVLIRHLRTRNCLLFMGAIRLRLADSLFNNHHRSQLYPIAFCNRHQCLEKAWPSFDGNINRRRNGEPMVFLCIGDVVGVKGRNNEEIV